MGMGINDINNWCAMNGISSLFLTPKQVSKLLGIKEKALAELRRQHRGPAFIRDGNFIFYTRASIVEYGNSKVGEYAEAERNQRIPDAGNRRKVRPYLSAGLIPRIGSGGQIDARERFGARDKGGKITRAGNSKVRSALHASDGERSLGGNKDGA